MKSSSCSCLLSLINSSSFANLVTNENKAGTSAYVCLISVCDEHREFKDMKLFYRFRKDDGTFPLDSEAKVFMRGQRIYEKYGRTHNTNSPGNDSLMFCMSCVKGNGS